MSGNLCDLFVQPRGSPSPLAVQPSCTVNLTASEPSLLHQLPEPRFPGQHKFQLEWAMTASHHKSVSAPCADTELCKVSFQPQIFTEGCTSMQKIQLREALLLLTWCSHPASSYTQIAAAGSAPTPGLAPQRYQFIL